MNITIKKIGNLYQIDDNETPIESSTLRTTLASLNQLSDAEVSKIMDSIDEKGELSLTSEANTGVIVDLYEVDYPTPPDPEKSTQDLASHLDEKKDFVTQYLFPDSYTEDVIVGLRQDLMENHKMPTPSNEGRSKVGKLNFKIAWATQPSEEQLDYIRRTGRMPQGLLEGWFGMNLSNWIRFTPPQEFGSTGDVCVAADVFRYILAVQVGDDVEDYEIDYETLVDNDINPLDLLAVLEEVISNGPDNVRENTTLDELIEDGGEEVKRIQVGRRAR